MDLLKDIHEKNLGSRASADTLTELSEHGDFYLLGANGRRKRQTSVYLPKRKQQTKICFCWTANSKQKLTIAVSGNVPNMAGLKKNIFSSKRP
jgi:hypothetical protein